MGWESGIGGNPGELCISGVAHEAFVDVNEEGTEAAADLLLGGVRLGP